MMNPAYKSLLEQMHIDEIEIARRKELLGFSQADADLLAQAHPFIIQRLDDIVEEFYHQQTSIEEIALIIGDSETLQRLYIAQKRYIDDLFTGFYDKNYVNNRLRIGMVHKRIGVEPKHYLSAVKTLREILQKTIVANIVNEDVRSATLSALDKVFFFDIEFVFDTYIRSLLSELEVVKDRAVQYAAILEEKVTERTRELEQLSRTDPLTNLLNQRAFREELRKELVRAQRLSTRISLIYFDLDGFKKLNDTEGHYKGDQVLKTIGRLLLEIKRETDIAARFGGDEFCIALPETDADGVKQFCERLTQTVQQTQEGITFSIGVVQSGPEYYDNIDTLLRKADTAMYEMKHTHHITA